MTLEELKKRVTELEDLEEIKELHRQYVFWLNSQQWEEMIDCFAENAIADIGETGLRKGKEEIAKLFKNNISVSNKMNFSCSKFKNNSIDSSKLVSKAENTCLINLTSGNNK